MKVPTRSFACLLAMLMSLSAWSQSNPISITFQNLLLPTGRGLSPTAELLKADGKRVRIEGFMAQMEAPPLGGFWLCSTPVFQDESGAGTGDLPPNAIFVVVRGAGKKPIALLQGRLAISGVLKLNKEAPRLTIILDSTKEISKSVRKGLP